MSSRYQGRHRGSQNVRRVPRSFHSGFALPTAAAAALVLTATGATVAETPTAIDLTGAQTARTKAMNAAYERAAETERRQQLALQMAAVAERTEEQRRVSRNQARRALARQKALQAKQAALLAAEAERKARQRWVRPILGASFTSGFGWRWGRMHNGNDFAAPIGTPLYAMSSGRVVSAGYGGGYGNKVEIEFWDGTVAWYAHMDSISVRTGQLVEPGDRIGSSGNTGNSTGPHLHLEIHPGGGSAINPAGWLASRGL